MAKQTFLSISKNNGVGLLTRPIDQALTLKETITDSCTKNIYRSNGTIFDLKSKLQVYDYMYVSTSTSGCYYDYAKSLYYLRETIPAGSNALITAKKKVIILDYDVADIDNIIVFDKSMELCLKIKNNQYPINIFTTNNSTAYEVTYG